MAFAMTQVHNKNKTLFRPRGVSGYSVGRNGYSMSRSLGAIDIYKKNKGLGEGVSTSSKILSIPAKRWGSIQEFLKDFPELKLSLFLSLYPNKRVEYPNRYPYNYGKANFINIPTWESDKRINVHANIVKYAISKQLPIKYSAYLGTMPKRGELFELDSDGSHTTDKAIGYTQHVRVDNRVIQEPWFENYRTLLEKVIGRVNGGRLMGTILPFTEPYQAVLVKFLYPEIWSAWQKSYASDKPALAFVDVYWEKMIDAWLTSPTMVTNFEAYSSDEQIQFQEVYGITDPTQMAPYTISYIVTKDAPPTPDNRWNSTQFWSELFKKREGFAILQAVAEVYPVKVKTRAMAFKEDPSFYTKNVVNDWAKEVFQYVFNDFNIEVTPDAKILIRYNRDIKTETIEYSTKKKKTWATYVGYAILAVGLTVATMGVATAIVGAMAAASAAASTAAPVVSGGYAAGQGALLSTSVLTSGGYAAGTGAATAATAGGVTMSQVATAASIAAAASKALPAVSSVAQPAASIAPAAVQTTGIVSQVATTGSSLVAAGKVITPMVTTAAKVASTGMQISSAYDAITASKAGIETPQPFVFDTPTKQPIQAGMLGAQLDVKTLLLFGAFGTVAFMLFKNR